MKEYQAEEKIKNDIKDIRKQQKIEGQVNEHIIKLSGKVNIPYALNQIIQYDIACRGAIEDINKKNKHNGSYEYTYKFVPTGEIVLNDSGEKVSLKIGKSQSQLFRFQLNELNTTEMDSDVHYQWFMTLLRHFLNPYIYEYVKTLKEKEDKGIL